MYSPLYIEQRFYGRDPTKCVQHTESTGDIRNSLPIIAAKNISTAIIGCSCMHRTINEISTEQLLQSFHKQGTSFFYHQKCLKKER